MRMGEGVGEGLRTEIKGMGVRTKYLDGAG